MPDREYDIVVFGATGFTGALTAEYLARNAPAEMRWALAGRSAGKLESARAKIAEAHPKAADLPLLQADVNDPSSVRRLAESTRVVITTVGPYILYGEALVAACAAAGTDYVDLTGEPEFVDTMWLRYNEQAEQSGARIVHSCGFDSIPYDLGVLYTVGRLPENTPIHIDGVRACRRHVLRRHLPLGGRDHGPPAPGDASRQGTQAARATPRGPQGQGCRRQAPQRALSGWLGGAVSDDRPTDGGALCPRARSLRAGVHL